MILFSGHGDIASHFSKKHSCNVFSLRNTSIADLEILLKDYDIVIHNAANLNPQNLEEAINDNFILTKNIIDTLARVNKGAKFIYLSSMSMLNNANDYLDPLQMSQYAFSKYLAELYTLASPLEKTISVRFSTIFYENPAKDGLSKLIYTAFHEGKISIINSGKAKRDFIPIDVLTQYLYKICIAENIVKHKFNICSGVATSFAEVVDILKLRLPKLIVENTILNEVPDVLCDFDLNELKELGIEKFKLSDYLDDYLKKISI